MSKKELAEFWEINSGGARAQRGSGEEEEEEVSDNARVTLPDLIDTLLFYPNPVGILKGLPSSDLHL